MSGKIAWLSRKLGQKEFDRNARKVIYTYVERLCREPFKVRLSFAWRFVRGRNPHTGVKVPRPKRIKVRVRD